MTDQAQACTTADVEKAIDVARAFTRGVPNMTVARWQLGRALNALDAVLVLLAKARGCCYNGTTTPGAWENFDPDQVRATILANLIAEDGADA